MKKRTCAAVAAVSVLLSAIITFQITSTTYRAKNKAELDSLKTEYESSFGGKMNVLGDDFLSLYNGRCRRGAARRAEHEVFRIRYRRPLRRGSDGG